MMKSINLNKIIKVQLTTYGIDIYYHQWDHLINQGCEFNRQMPKIDSEGFTEFQLWDLMRLYGPYMNPLLDIPFQPVEIYFEEEKINE